MKRVIALMLGLIPVFMAGVSVTATVNKNTLSLADRLEYTIQITSEEKIGISEPAPPEIELFTFVNMRSSTRSSTSIVNFKSHREYQRNYIYTYIPRREGESTIRTQDLQIGNKVYSTPEIKLRVVSSAAGQSGQSSPPLPGAFDFDDPDMPWSASRMTGSTMILAHPQKQKVYRGQPAIISYYLYTDQMVRSFNLTDEEDFPGYGKSAYEQPGSLDYEVVAHDGKRFQRALIKRLMLLPNTTGDLQAPILSGRARIYEFGYMNQPVSSEAAWLEVLPLPDKSVPADFGGAVGSFRVFDDVSASEISLGEAITYSLRIAGTGNFNQFTHPQFPEQSAQVSAPMAIDRLNAGIEGSRTLYYTIIPAEKGSYTLPSLSFSWFDPDSRSYLTFKSEERRIQVKAANVISYFSGLLESGKPQALHPMLSRRFYPDYRSHLHSFWYWLLVALILGGTLVSAYLAWLRAKARNNPEYYSRMMADKALKKYLREASEAVQNNSTDFYSLAENGLLRYLREKYGISNRLSTEEMMVYLRDKGVREEFLEELGEFIAICQRQRFSPQKSDAAQMQKDYQMLRQIIGSFSKKGVIG